MLEKCSPGVLRVVKRNKTLRDLDECQEQPGKYPAVSTLCMHVQHLSLPSLCQQCPSQHCPFMTLHQHLYLHSLMLRSSQQIAFCSENIYSFSHKGANYCWNWALKGIKTEKSTATITSQTIHMCVRARACVCVHKRTFWISYGLCIQYFGDLCHADGFTATAFPFAISPTCRRNIYPICPMTSGMPVTYPLSLSFSCWQRIHLL